MTSKCELKRILVTGSQGYIGTELMRKLHKINYSVTGLDAGYFTESTLETFNEPPSIRQDLRDQRKLNLEGFDAVIHLAALSNDPLGEIDPIITYLVNRDAAINLATRAKNQGVSRFIFVSTQSIYGISDSSSELGEDAPKNPITAYAKSKWDAEQEILSMSTRSFTTIAVRPSTVFGWGSRIRNDIIFNNMISSGLKNGRIEVHTDGTPHRPIVHIMDVIDFLILLLNSPSQILANQAYNLGRIGGNYTVLEIAQAASSCLGEIPIVINTEALTDQRSYRVNFEKAKKELNFSANRTLEYGGAEILEQYSKLSTVNKDKYFQECSRLHVLKSLIDSGRLLPDLSWV